MMDQLIANFTDQLQEAYIIGQKQELTQPTNEIKNVLISGLGGSGIGGSLVKTLVNNELKIPFDVNKDYTIPNYVDEHTLFIVSSYSGNTEETLQAFELARKKGAKIVCVSSGGKIIDIAKQEGIDHVIIPGGMPPRACLALSFVQQLFILYHFHLVEHDFQSDLLAAVNLLDEHEEPIKAEAKEIADQLHGKLPIIYSGPDVAPVSVRFRQQLNENSKILCWHHVIPEMNHNELVGWRTKDENLSVIILRNNSDSKRIEERIEINKTIVQRYTSNIIEIYSKGETQLQRALYLINLTDWVSFYLAENRHVDAVEVEVIDYLKSELAKL